MNSDYSYELKQLSSELLCWKVEARKVFNLPLGKAEGFISIDVQMSKILLREGVGLSQLNQTDKRTFVAGLRSKSFLAHLEPQPMLPQQLTERCGWIEFQTALEDDATYQLWTAKYITRCV